MTRVSPIVCSVACALLLTVTACDAKPTFGSAPETKETASSKPAVTVTKTVPDRTPHTLVLKAKGHAEITSIRYVLDHEVKKKGPVDLPWRASLKVPRDGKPHAWSLLVRYEGSGQVELTGFFDGQSVGYTKSYGSGSGVKGSANLNGTVNG